VFAEKASGAKADRAELRKVMSRLGEGDVLVVTRLDRLAICSFQRDRRETFVGSRNLDTACGTTNGGRDCSAVHPRDGDNNEVVETTERGRLADRDFAALHIKHQSCRWPGVGPVHPTW
jgi:hypothetical protein